MFFFFNDYKNDLYTVFNSPNIQGLAMQKDYYYQKAKDKFEEFQGIDTKNIDLDALITVAKQKDFSYRNMLNSYDVGSAEYKLLLLIGQAITYFDTKGAMKNELNEYDDKRAIASAFVRQNIWVESLLKFKSGVQVQMLPNNVRNTILYIQYPESNINIISENWRTAISNALFDNRNVDLFEEMKNLGIVAENPLNNGVLYTWILLSDSIRKLWDKTTEQTAYWLGGSTYDHRDVSKEFIEKSIYAMDFDMGDISDVILDPQRFEEWIEGIPNKAAKEAFKLFSQIKQGDKIALKSSFAKGAISMLRIKAFGTVLESFESGYSYNDDLGHTIPVKWESIDPNIDYELGKYRKTIHQVIKKEDILTIFSGHKQYLEDDFRTWVLAQAKDDSQPFASRTIENYVRMLKICCRELDDINLDEPNLFYITSAREFTELMARIKSSTDFDVVNAKDNRAFSAAMNLYEKFLSEREAGNIQTNMPIDSGIETSPFTTADALNNKSELETLVLNCLGGLKKTHTILTRAPLYELNDGKNVLIRTSKLLERGYFYGLQRPIINGTDKIDYLVLVRGNEGFYKIPFEIIKGLCLNGSISLADKRETAEGYRIHLTPNNESYELKFPGDKPSMPIDKFFTKFIYEQNDFLSEVYMLPEKYDDIVALLYRKKNIILQGAPGVGKSYLAKRLAYSIIGIRDKSRVEMMQFHQSYSYEDFIEGYRPDGKGGFVLKHGVFYKFCERARKGNGNYYFIIDEINRGNLSKIMGELMLLIEHDKRGEEFAVPLTYSGESFFVPENVYIIGMMNTADRSLAMIDYALRRRFSFVPIKPAFSNPDFIKYIKKDNETLGDKILAEMTALNVDIKNDLGAGFQVGHSYFCNCDDINEQWYVSILKYEIIPLLDEYWFDNEKQHSKWVKGLLPDEKNPD